ncbi:hypothetical protein RMATCC62417_03882 [Rhizopus microsporus]|nr:hypothetical protein RMATCC62417_03882 [Rhizopus microsporus]
MSQPFKYFDQQVAGHDKLMLLTTSTDDLMIIKPCKPKEVNFYQDAQNYPEFLDFLPQCYGTLRAATEHDLSILETSELVGDSTNCYLMETVQGLDQQEQNVCLENILHGFTRPCIMDLKMGSLLYDADASEEKRQKMIYQSVNTTSSTLGLRISGLKVYDTVEHRYATYEKRFGKTRTVENTVEAIMAFLFPTSAYGLKTEEYRNYSSEDQQKKDEPIPSKYMRWIIECFIDTLQEIKEAIVLMPNLQLIGSSLLFVYEGDRTAAEKTWKYMLDEDRQKGKGKQTDEEEEDDNLAPKMCDLRLIDFAHSDWHSEREEQDPDLVKGFDNIIDILYQCLKIQHQEKL